MLLIRNLRWPLVVHIHIFHVFAETIKPISVIFTPEIIIVGKFKFVKLEMIRITIGHHIDMIGQSLISQTYLARV